MLFTAEIDAALLTPRPSQFAGATPDLCLPADPLSELQRKILEQNALTPPQATSFDDMLFLVGNAVG